MDRRHYLCSTAALLPAIAGCVSEYDSTGVSSDDGPVESTPSSDLEGAPGEFESVGGEAIWAFDSSERIQSYALGGGLAVGTDAELTMLSASGAVEWRVEAPSPRYSLAIHGGSVFTTGFGGRLAARDAASGDRRWRQDVDTGTLSLTGFGDSTMFAHVTNDDPGVFPLHAFDTETGTMRWRAETGTVMGAAVSTGLCLTWSVVDGLSAFGVETGEQQWGDDTLGDDYSGSLHAVGDVLCASTEGTVHAYSLPEGATRWETSLANDGRIIRTALPDASHPNRIYVADGSGDLLAIETTSGVELWRANPTPDGERGYTGMALDVDSVVHLTGNVLAAYESADGSRRWAYSIGAYDEVGRPVVAAGNVHLPVTRADGRIAVRAFDLETGQRRWRAPLGSAEKAAGRLGATPRPIGVHDGYLLLVVEETIYGVPIDRNETLTQ